VLEKKNQRVEPNLVITQQVVDSSVKEIKKQNESRTAAMSSLSPFVSKEFVCLDESEEKVPISVLRDTGAKQSLILDSVLPFYDKSSAGVSVLLLGVGISSIRVPLHAIVLQSDVVSGTLVVGLRPPYL